jgi:hypothetical protein
VDSLGGVYQQLFGTREKWILPQFPCRSRGALWRDNDDGSDVRQNPTAQQNLARPHICRLTSFRRWIWPSIWPLLQGRITAALTAFSSRLSPSQSVLSVINRLIVAEEGVPVERRYSFPVGIFTGEVKALLAGSILGKGQRRGLGPHGHDTGYLTLPRSGQPRSRLGRGGRGHHSAPVPDL